MQQNSRFVIMVGLQNGRRVIPIATVSDPQFVMQAARHAMTEASAQANLIAAIDPALGRLHTAEAHRVHEILGAAANEVSRGRPAA